MINTVLPGAERPSPELAQRLSNAYASRGPGYSPRTHHLEADGRPRYTNRLIAESSPYLLQHAHNPVSWWPWSDQAFSEARRLGRPVFLSIGYSTCHWCHVMEAESFEDEEIAAFLNSHFIPIKVDREERPDVDAVYMSAVQQLTGSGGWPMSVFLDPDRRPFFGGTYFPPRDGVRGARHGFLSILQELATTYARDPERVQRATHALTEAVRTDMSRSAPPAEGVPPRDIIAAAVDFYRRAFDGVHGGLRRAPKFPSNLPARLLFRHHHRTGDQDALHMAVFTLEKMAAGGMYDQLGGGFHRYSTDERWLVPHFEKMLYDNALLAVAYAEAHQVTGREDMARIAREICEYVLRDMTDPDGGFYSATDADTEGEEGRFFVWTEAEIRSVLGDGSDTETFLRHYDVRPQGNWEGSTILHVPRPDEEVTRALQAARAKLLEVRARRPPPLRDEKILAAWNGLMISGMSVAGRVLDQPRYVNAARRAAEFLLTKLRPDGETLFRSFKDGRASQRGFLDDYAFAVAGLLDLFEATFELRWLEQALLLADATERHFADRSTGGWFMTSDAHDPLIARENPSYDGAEPSGTSIALMNACRLATFTDDARWRTVAERGFRAHASTLTQNPLAMTEALMALDFFLDRPLEILLVWPNGSRDDDATRRSLERILRMTFLPARVMAGGSEEKVQRLGALVSFARSRAAVGRAPTVYVCRQGQCELPATAPDLLMRQLRVPPPQGNDPAGEPAGTA